MSRLDHHRTQTRLVTMNRPGWRPNHLSVTSLQGTCMPFWPLETIQLHQKTVFRLHIYHSHGHTIVYPVPSWLGPRLGTRVVVHKYQNVKKTSDSRDTQL